MRRINDDVYIYIYIYIYVGFLIVEASFHNVLSQFFIVRHAHSYFKKTYVIKAFTIFMIH